MSDGHSANEHRHAFRDPTSLTRWTRVFLGICVVSNSAFIWLWMSAGTDGTLPPAGIVSEERFLPHVLWYYPVQWLTAILVLIWTYRANHNARQLGAADMEFTPLWAVGSYCVPVLWFWTPFQVMREIWTASSNPSQWRNEPRSRLLAWWWALWIVAFSAWIADEILIALSSDVGGFMSWIGIISPFFEIPAALLLVVIVTRIHDRQMEHYRNRVDAGD